MWIEHASTHSRCKPQRPCLRLSVLCFRLAGRPGHFLHSSTFLLPLIAANLQRCECRGGEGGAKGACRMWKGMRVQWERNQPGLKGVMHALQAAETTTNHQQGNSSHRQYSITGQLLAKQGGRRKAQRNQAGGRRRLGSHGPGGEQLAVLVAVPSLLAGRYRLLHDRQQRGAVHQRGLVPAAYSEKGSWELSGHA